MMLTPTLLEAVMDTASNQALSAGFRSLRRVFVSGEPSSDALHARLRAALPARCDLQNLLSSNEAGDLAVWDRSMRAFQPLAGVRVFVLEIPDPHDSNPGEPRAVLPGEVRPRPRANVRA